jgi:SHS2 domain-containing protein
MYRLLDHTADLMIEAEGPTRDAALGEAARALVRVVTGKDPHARPDQEVVFQVEAPDAGSLVVAFLSEVLWILESQGVLWLGGGVHIEEDGILRALARGNGVRYDPMRHGRGVEVKAVTYHALEFGPHGGGWRLRVVLDI